MTDIPENGSGVEPKLSTSGQPKAKGPEVPVAGRRKMVKPKMDFAKALSIMGFSTSRTLDPSGGHDAKVELNAALSRKMADIEKRKRASMKKDEKNKTLESQKSKAEDKLRDEIRTLHEAYQFLSRKYIKLAETLGQMNQEELEAYAKKKEEERKDKKNKNKMKKTIEIEEDLDAEDMDLLQYDADLGAEKAILKNMAKQADIDEHGERMMQILRAKKFKMKTAMSKKKRLGSELEKEEAMEKYLEVKFAEEELQKELDKAKSDSDSEDEIEDIQGEEEVFENTEEMEVDLCALINETFRMDDDYWFDESDAFYVKRNSRMSVEDD